jgi:hypothetical protein
MLRVFTFALLAAAVGVGLAGADEVKKDVKKGAQETKEVAKEGAQATKREIKDDVHGAIHQATGTIKSVSGGGFVLTEDDGKELAFEVDGGTVVYVKGAHHTINALKADGKPAQVTEFLSAADRVSVRYSKPEDRMIAKDIRVKQ